MKVNRGGPQIDDRKPDELPDPWYARIIHLFEDEVSYRIIYFLYIQLMLNSSTEKQWLTFAGLSMVQRPF